MASPLCGHAERATTRGLVIRRIAEGATDMLEVEAQPAVRAAKPERAELRGVRVDPLALDAERSRERGRVDVAHRSGCGLSEQLGDTLCDRLDIFPVERHG